MRRLASLVALTMVAASAETPLPVTIGGRVAQDADGGLRFGWPGVYFESRFRGTAVRVRFVADQDFLRLLIDGRVARQFAAPGAVDTTIGGLPPGEHVVRLEKLTENQIGEARFIGFYPTAGGVSMPPRPTSRAIEFIGDSHTVGYGNTSLTRVCSRQAVHDTTDTQAAFGPIVARYYAADYRINAYSGIGVVRNYAGTNPDRSMPTLYARSVPGDPASSPTGDDDAWRPQIIVIDLGTNDFSTPLHAGERWADDAALRADYRGRYTAFIDRLAAAQPQARFVVMGAPAFYADVQTVAATVNDRRPGLVTPLLFDGLALDACDSHPSLADDRLLARLIENVIDRLRPDWVRQDSLGDRP